MAAKKKAGKKSCKARVVLPPAKLQRYRFVKDDDGHNYLIPDEMENQFVTWLEAGPYWEDYDGEDFSLYRIDGVSRWTFADARKD